MKTMNSILGWITVFVVAFIISLPVSNYAQDRGHDKDDHDRSEHHDADRHDHHDWDHERDHDRGHDRHEWREHHDDYRDVVVRDRHYYYRGGAFYERGPSGYIVATAPIGASIDVLPGGYRVIRRHHIRYYYYGGVYYQFHPSEHVYVVVGAPF